jgi:DNA-binding NtrC family response regulator
MSEIDEIHALESYPSEVPPLFNVHGIAPLDDVINYYISHSMKVLNNDKDEVAHRLGISRRTVHSRMKEMNA